MPPFESIDPSTRLNSLRVNFELLKKYNRSGPRYTSYPTAPLFKKEFGSEQFEQEIIQTNINSDRPLSLYFHIPFCEALCYFCGCTMLITKDREKISEYLNYLEKEIEKTSQLIDPKRKITQLQWGGGTPTYLSPNEIKRIGNFIRRKFENFDSSIEAGCEIDPRGLTKDHLIALKEVGFNRISMGVQDFNPIVQIAINRIQPELMTREVIEWSRELGFRSINLDLIYGLPFQTLKSFEETLDQVIELNPDRLAIFNYAHVPWLKKHQVLLQEKDLPTPDQKLAILKMTIEKLVGAGYLYIGMDHFAKPNDELAIAQKNKTLYRNFQGYSTQAGSDVYAFGMSAISQFENIYAQNAKILPEYYQAIREDRFSTGVGYRLTEDDQIRKKVITRLMCDFELDENEIEKEFNINFGEYFDADLRKLDPLIQDGLLSKRDSKLVVSPIGRLLIRNIVMNFDAYLDAVSKEEPVFSRTV